MVNRVVASFEEKGGVTKCISRGRGYDLNLSNVSPPTVTTPLVLSAPTFFEAISSERV